MTDPSIHKALDPIRGYIKRLIEHVEKDHPDADMTQECSWPDDIMQEFEALLSREITKARLDEAYLASGGEFFMHNGKYYKDREILRERLKDLQEGKE